MRKTCSPACLKCGHLMSSHKDGACKVCGCKEAEDVPLLLMVDRRTAETYYRFLTTVRGTLKPDMPEKDWEDGVRHFNNHIISHGLKASADLAAKFHTQTVKERLSGIAIIMGSPLQISSFCDTCSKKGKCDIEKEMRRREKNIHNEK